MIKRFLFTIILLVAVLYAPWWLTLILALGGAFYFSAYYEVIALGVLIDLLYGMRGGLGAGYGVWGVAISLVLFFGLERIKRELR